MSTRLIRWAGLLSLVQGLLLFVPLIVLGAAIEWPASLDDPASVALPRLLENEGAVRLGYVAYLIYSILFAVTIILLSRVTGTGATSVLSTLALSFALASTVARCIGIVRWLLPAPEIAETYLAATDPTEQMAIATSFDALNSYGGTIGEILGVGIFAALAIGFLSADALKATIAPRWIGLFGMAAAVAAAVTAVGIFGLDAGAAVATGGTTVVQLWFLATGIWLVTRGRTHLNSASARSAGH